MTFNRIQSVELEGLDNRLLDEQLNSDAFCFLADMIQLGT